MNIQWHNFPFTNCINFKILGKDLVTKVTFMFFIDGYSFQGKNIYVVTIYMDCTSAWTKFWDFSYLSTIFYYLLNQSNRKVMIEIIVIKHFKHTI